MNHGPEKSCRFLENISDACAYHQVITDSAGVPEDYVFVDMNRAFEKMAGISRQHLIGRRVSEALPESLDSGIDWKDIYSRMAFSGESIHFEKHSASRESYFEISAYAEHGEYIFVVFRDITDSKEKKERTKELNCLFSFSRLLCQEKYSLERVLEETVQLLHSSFQDPLHTGVCLHFQGSTYKTRNYQPASWKIVSSLEVKAEKVGFLEATYLQQPAFDRSPFLREEELMLDTIAGILSCAIEQRVAEEALRKAHRRLDEIIECLPDAVFVLDSDGVVIAWNRAMEELTGVPKKDMLGRGNYEYAIPFYGKRQPLLADLVLLSEDEYTRLKGHYDYIHWSGEALYGEVFCPEVYGGTGAYLWSSASRLRDAAGHVYGALESIRDITDLKETEEIMAGYILEQKLQDSKRKKMERPGDQETE